MNTDQQRMSRTPKYPQAWRIWDCPRRRRNDLLRNPPMVMPRRTQMEFTSSDRGRGLERQWLPLLKTWTSPRSWPNIAGADSSFSPEETPDDMSMAVAAIGAIAPAPCRVQVHNCALSPQTGDDGAEQPPPARAPVVGVDEGDRMVTKPKPKSNGQVSSQPDEQ